MTFPLALLAAHPTSAAFPAFFATSVTGMQTVRRYSQGYRVPHRAVAWTCLSGFDA
ncbi:hypothetical protein FHR58_004076 [Xanthomonas arboricola]|nr:hypothetical protein [Xanthomonas arboricola]